MDGWKWRSRHGKVGWKISIQHKILWFRIAIVKPRNRSTAAISAIYVVISLYTLLGEGNNELGWAIVVKLENHLGLVRNMYYLVQVLGSQGFQYELCGSYNRDYNI